MKNIFKLPSQPKALPIRPFCKKDDYAWDDWHAEMKSKYSIRYFFNRTLPFWWRVNVLHKIDSFSYWLKSHFFPSKRHHMLDLRQKTASLLIDPYRYGWIDADLKIKYACFNILVSFMEKEHKGKYKEYLKFQEEHGLDKKMLSDMKELYSIYEWIKIDSIREQKEIMTALDEWSKLLDKFNSSEEIDKSMELFELNKKHSKLEKEYLEKETRMLVHLIQLRKYMWM